LARRQETVWNFLKWQEGIGERRQGTGKPSGKKGSQKKFAKKREGFKGGGREE